VKGDWDAWNARLLADEPIVRLILDGTVVRVRLDRKATAISLLVVIGVRTDGQKVLLAVRSMGGESAEAWRAVLDDLFKRGLRRPEFLIVDGAHRLRRARKARLHPPERRIAVVHVSRPRFHSRRAGGGGRPADRPRLCRAAVGDGTAGPIGALARSSHRDHACARGHLSVRAEPSDAKWRWISWGRVARPTDL
jgi:Transposase, Mutator family